MVKCSYENCDKEAKFLIERFGIFGKLPVCAKHLETEKELDKLIEKGTNEENDQFLNELIEKEATIESIEEIKKGN